MPLLILAAAGAEIFTFLGVIAFVGGGIGLGIYFERRRREALQAVAQGLNLEFFPNGEGLNFADLSQFQLTTRGHSRGAQNLMRGSAQGIAVEIFDYRFTSGSGKNKTTHRCSVARFCFPGLRMPSFELRPEGLFSKLGAALGMQDIDFPAHPKFSGMHVLKAKDEAASHRLFDDELITALENVKGVSVEGAGDQLLIYRAGKTSRPEEIRTLFEEAFRIYTRFADAGQRTGFSTQGGDLEATH